MLLLVLIIVFTSQEQSFYHALFLRSFFVVYLEMPNFMCVYTITCGLCHWVLSWNRPKALLLIDDLSSKETCLVSSLMAKRSCHRLATDTIQTFDRRTIFVNYIMYSYWILCIMVVLWNTVPRPYVSCILMGLVIIIIF